MSRPPLGTLFFLIAFVFAAIVSGGLLVKEGYLWIAVMLGLITISTLVIFLKKELLHLRFMYPGLLTFFLFMILPICFSIYVGFTNLSTGHFLSQQQVHNLLLEETYFAEGETTHSFKLKKSKIDSNQWIIYIPSKNDISLSASFSFEQEDKVVQLSPSKEVLQGPLSIGEIFSIRKPLSKIQFKLPNGNSIRYYRSDMMAPIKHRFSSVSSTQIRDNTTDIVYSADQKLGQYSSEDLVLAPGFFVMVGFDNFTSIWKSPHIRSSFIKVSTWTIIWAFLSVLTTFTLGMILALFLNDKNLRLKSLYRVLLVIPYSIPFFISALIFKGMFNQDFGVLNEGMKALGLPAIGWLTDPFWAKFSALTVNLWLGFPYMFLLTTGILQSIPSSLYEAAAIDGANRWQSFRHITLPMIMSAITPLLVGSFAFNLNNFVGIYLLTGGGPPIKGAITPVGETDILISYTYRLAFEGAQGQDFGLASSIALFIFVIIAVLTLINFRLSGMMSQEAR